MQTNIFKLAEIQLQKENKKITADKIITYAIIIRKWLDKHKGMGEAILSGRDFYQYGTRIILK